MIKYCLWCGKEIKRPARRLSEKEWAERKLHVECVMSYRHHGCAQKDIPQPPERRCLACDKLLVRGKREQWVAWIKRTCCNKSCAASGKVRARTKVPVVAKAEHLRLGVIQYVPGSPEFKQIAALYGG